MSRAFLVGGAGFIGRRVVAALAEAGEEAAAPSRDDFDIAQGAPEALAEKLAGVDVVVNCAGIGRDGRVDNLRAAHVDGPSRLAAACRIAGVRRLVHVSALGAAPGDPSRFLASKGEGEAALRAVEGLEVCVVRPSLALGAGGAVGDFFAALAALPSPPRLGPGSWRVQPLHVDELAHADRQARARAAGPRKRRGGRPGSDDDRRARARLARLARTSSRALPAAAAPCARGAGVGERDRRGRARRPRAGRGCSSAATSAIPPAPPPRSAGRRARCG